MVTVYGRFAGRHRRWGLLRNCLAERKALHSPFRKFSDSGHWSDDGRGGQRKHLRGQAFTYERVFTVGEGDIGSVMDNVLLAKGVETGEVRGFVVEAQSGQGISGAKVLVFEPGEEAPWSQWTTDVSLDDTNPDGSFGGTLPLGDWELLVYQQGRPEGERFSLTVGKDPIDLTLQLGKPGRAEFTITDETGLRVPAKITVIPAEGEAQRNSIFGDGFVGGSPEAVIFAPYGHGEASLLPGRYRAIATRGPEYELDEQVFTVTADRQVELQMQVIHSVDTSGWVGADLHVHGMPSYDAGVKATDRVMSMVAEGVEFMASTDHDYIFDYAPTIEDMELTRWLQSSVGVEVTPLELGHFIAFGLEHDFLSDAGGAFDWKGWTPSEILSSLSEAGNGNIEPVTFVAHPRAGILGYFDQYGFDPFGGNPGTLGQPGFPSVDIPLNSQVSDFVLFTEQNFTLDFDALELFTGKHIDYIRTPTDVELSAHADSPSPTDHYDILTRTMSEMEGLQDGTIGLGYGVDGQVDDWFTLLNLGYRHTALANSDSHGLTSIESGCPRNFVETGVDNPEFVDESDIAAALRDHKVVASFGPFVRFWIDEQGIGSELSGSEEKTLQVESQAPSWMAVTHVELYQNGTLIQEWNRDRTDALTGEPWWLETTIQPDQDSWYVVIASGEDSLYPLFTPVEIPPVELEDVVTEAVGAVLDDTSLLGYSVENPKTFDIVPYALTNPIWVDIDGDGFDAPGVPAWQIAPEPPEAGEDG